MERKTHWENVFSTKLETEVSWYQKKPNSSLDSIQKLNVAKDAKIIDIGGGDSYLIDELLNLGYTNLYLLDISVNAIERIKNRLGANASKVTFIVSDVIDFKPDTTFDFWHDRASFHFLTEENQIIKYAELANLAVVNQGNLVIGTFSESGPKKCSGLDITQYTEQKLKSVFETNFDLITGFTEDHKTPFNTIQNFIFCSFKKKIMMTNILVLCTGNSCRSQMAHGYLQNFANAETVTIYSAGVETHGVNPLAVAIMNEDRIDISNHTSNNVDEYRDISFDYVITVCDNAKERCPFFPTKAIKLHHNFPDPAKANGSTDAVIEEFRNVRAMIKAYCREFITINQLN